MGKKTFTRILCMALAALFLVSSAVIAVSADDVYSGNVTEKSITDYIDTANTISYDQYISDNRDYFNAAPARTGDEARIVFDATEGWVYWTGGVDKFGKGKGSSVRIDAVNGWTLTDANGNVYNKDEASAAQYNLDALARLDTYDGTAAIYTPNTGSVSWVLNLTDAGITKPGLYSVSLIYYPVEGKAASIEREFFINYEIPFSEARSLTLAKRWGSYLQSGNAISALYAIYRPAKKIQKNATKLAAALAEVKQEAEALGIVCAYSQDGTYLMIEQPLTVTSAINKFIDKYNLRFFENDDNNNELRPTMKQSPEWMEYALRDGGGYYANQFGFLIEPSETGTVVLTLAGVNEPMALSKIVFTPYTTLNSYEKYLTDLTAAGVDTAKEGTDQVKLEGEYSSNTSTNVIYPVEDRASALTSPNDTTRMMLNTIGTEKWETAGQWAEYRFSVSDSGMYDIYSRFKQSYLDGLYVSRSLQIFTDYSSKAAYQAAHGGSIAGYYDGIPFAEAAELRYDYGSSWQVTNLTNTRNKVKKGETKNDFRLYFEKDVVYTLRFEVTLGSMSDNVRKLEVILDALNKDYLDIVKLTGSSPDTYRDYSFSSLLPATLIDMIRQSRALTELSNELKKNTASTYTGICDKLATLLDHMGYNEDTIAKSLKNFKSYVGSLGTFLTDAKTQPLQLDYLVIQGASAKKPKANSNIFVSFGHEFSGFMQSFFRDYNNMGARADASSTESVNVWLAYGRDQAQVIRNLATNDFTTNSGIAVDLKLVSAGTLLPSILAGMGPHAYIGLGQADVINYAIRGALMNIEDMEGFDEVAANFNEAAMVVLRMDDADGDSHCYGLPENQQFPMMFVRIDILANLDIEIPRTWEEVYVAQSKLESNNMEIGVTTNYKIFLYQLGGELFADNGMRINLDSAVGLEAFETMCNMFTQYSFPYTYNAANRFRTGEMPIIIADYTTLYNHLKVFATELDGAWSFVPLPGYVQKDANGNVIYDADGNPSINNCSVSAVTAVVMIKGKNEVVPSRYKTDEEYKAALKKQYGTVWEFVKWYTDYPCQVEYATEMVAIIGDSAKHSTANYQALKEMPWTEAERTEVEKQFSNLASIPNYPGYYYIDRYTNFAFLAAYNKKKVAIAELLGYINTINKEITRKREEFKLETLEIGQTLLQKRSDQANKALDLLAERYEAAAQDNKYNTAYRTARYGITNQNLSLVIEAAMAFAQQLDPGDGSIPAIVSKRLDPDAVAQRTAYAQLKTQDWFVFVSKQTASSKNGGYKIESLKEQELVYFITECLCNIAVAIQTY